MHREGGGEELVEEAHPRLLERPAAHAIAEEEGERPLDPGSDALRGFEGGRVEDDLGRCVGAQEDMARGQAREVDVREGDAVAGVRLGAVITPALRRPARHRDELADQLLLAPHRLLEGRAVDLDRAQPPAAVPVSARLAGLDLEDQDPVLWVSDHEVRLAVLRRSAVAHRPGPGDVRIEVVCGRQGLP